MEKKLNRIINNAKKKYNDDLDNINMAILYLQKEIMKIFNTKKFENLPYEVNSKLGSSWIVIDIINRRYNADNNFINTVIKCLN